MWLMSVKPATVKNKRYTATFCKCKVKDDCKGGNHKTVHFGQPGATTYVDGGSEEKKKSYQARHSKSPGENVNDPDTAGALSWHLLWGASKSFRENIKKFKNRFSL